MVRKLSHDDHAAHIVAADMGYGHERPARSLEHLAVPGEGIVVANNYPGIPKRDKKLWTFSRKFYETLSRSKTIPVIGRYLFELLVDHGQEIAPFYPRRDLSKPTIQLHQMYASMKRGGLGRHLIETLAKNPVPIITTFFFVAFMAEEFDYPNDIWCVTTDSDISRAWAPKDPKRSRIKYFVGNDPTIIGEMAHVIDKGPSGPRSTASGGQDVYENLILLCPTHHTEIDKAPKGTFPKELLFKWKKMHESNVKEALESPSYVDIRQVCTAINRLLIDNKSMWQQFGPDSLEAKGNPMSNLKSIWDLRKLESIVPNNNQILAIIRRNEEYFKVSECETCAEFKSHAQAFENNCYKRTEGVPRFPVKFKEMIDHYV